MPSTSLIQVAVRLRPLNNDEARTQPVVHAASADKQVTAVRGYGKAQQRTIFNFDKVFDASATQQNVFDSTLKPVIKDVLFGYESTVFAYGQTGTGKTYTMEGDLNNPELFGVIPRSAEYIFQGLNKPDYVSYSVDVSCLEIYNEELRDLLVDQDQENISPFQSPTKKSNLNIPSKGLRPGSPSKASKLEIMEGNEGIVCRGLTEINVNSAEDVLKVMKIAQTHRRVGETKLNLKSSRSHCIFTMHLTAQKKMRDGKIFDTRGKLHLVDLAGSECAKAAALDKDFEKKDKKNKIPLSSNINETNKARVRERSNINRSLLTLGRVILMLNERSNKKNVRIPYRDSKLTRMLQDSLGGHCVTLVIATVSPSEAAIEETMSTLHYAQSASGISNKPLSVSYMKSPNSGSNTPLSHSSERGVDHWYEMEMRLSYLQSQLEEAQAELAQQYDGQLEFIKRAEKAEEEVLALQEVLEKTQSNLKSSVVMLKQSKHVISQQNKELERAKIEQQRMKRHFVGHVMRGVSDIMNKEMSRFSIQQIQRLQKIEQRNLAIAVSSENIRASSSDILIQVEKTNGSVFERSNEKGLSDRKMSLGTKLVNDSMRDLDMMWNKQRKLVDNFVKQSNDRMDSMIDHERAMTSITSSLKNECNVTGKFIVDDVRTEMNRGVGKLSDTVSKQNKYIQKSALSSTSKKLGIMRRDQSNVTEQFSRAVAGLTETLIEDKENLGKITDKQCAVADALRYDVEKKYDGFGNVLSKQIRSRIDARNENMIKSLQDFHDKSNNTITALSEESMARKANMDEFAMSTLENWTVAPISERKSIAYSKVLSSTPSDESLLQRLEGTENGSKLN